MKKCIVYYPFNIDKENPSASNIRPIKFIEGFKATGYEVELIMGYGKERKERIEEVKRKIEKGERYDFMYTESATEPTLLTEKNHIPKYLILDFKFFKYCKNKDIPIGLFYRDIYWRFRLYKENVVFHKRILAYAFYYYDLIMYKRYLKVLFLPSLLMKKYIPVHMSQQIYELPSGCEYIQKKNSIKKCDDEKIKILYVGGIDKKLYNMEAFIEAVYENKNFFLDICCRENEWDESKEQYEKYLNHRIQVIHKKGEELDAIAMEADLFSMVFEPSEYRSFAMPMKLFSYISYGKPIIGVKNTAAGDFIEKNKIGYVVEYDKREIGALLKNIELMTEVEMEEKVKNVKQAFNNNTWRSRAFKVAECLTYNLDKEKL